MGYCWFIFECKGNSHRRISIICWDFSSNTLQFATLRFASTDLNSVFFHLSLKATETIHHNDFQHRLCLFLTFVSVLRDHYTTFHFQHKSHLGLQKLCYLLQILSIHCDSFSTPHLSFEFISLLQTSNAPHCDFLNGNRLCLRSNAIYCTYVKGPCI